MRRCALFDTATTQMRGLWRLALVVGAVAARAVPTQLGRGTAEGALWQRAAAARRRQGQRVAVAMGHRLLAHLTLRLAAPFLLVLLLNLPFASYSSSPCHSSAASRRRLCKAQHAGLRRAIAVATAADDDDMPCLARWLHLGSAPPLGLRAAWLDGGLQHLAPPPPPRRPRLLAATAAILV